MKNTNNKAIVVHRRTGTRAGVMRWYKHDVEQMAKEGYVELSHQLDGQARGVLVLVLPKMATMVVTYTSM